MAVLLTRDRKNTHIALKASCIATVLCTVFLMTVNSNLNAMFDHYVSNNQLCVNPHRDKIHARTETSTRRDYHTTLMPSASYPASSFLPLLLQTEKMIVFLHQNTVRSNHLILKEVVRLCQAGTSHTSVDEVQVMDFVCPSSRWMYTL